MAKCNPHTGSRFDDFLKQEGFYDEMHAKVLKRVLTESLTESMEATKLGKTEMARRMGTSRSQLDRVLDPENTSVQLGTLIRAARAVGKVVEIKIKRQVKAA
ncbi:MAG: helix-turn-helix domain-containing protein [Acidiferrobacteraceae bacterium]